MSNPRNFTTKFNVVKAKLETALKPHGFNSLRRRRELVTKAASARPANLAEEARQAVQERRNKRNLDIIAGRAS